jgi:hypothetical protein
MIKKAGQFRECARLVAVVSIFALVNCSSPEKFSVPTKVYVEDVYLSKRLIDIADAYIRVNGLYNDQYTKKSVYDIYDDYYVFYSYKSLIDGVLYRGGAPGKPRFLSVRIERRTLKAKGHSFE